MPRIVRSPSSVLDYEEIWSYIAKDNRAAADRLIATLESKLELLATMPTMGKDESSFRPGLRSFPVGNILLFYREIADGIELARAIHGARDISADYFGDE
jgi:toxin ParE1/3/4